MTYLYAGLGIAMMSGIMVMLKVASNINNIYTYNYSKTNNYQLNSIAKDFDKDAIKILIDTENGSTKPSNICESVLTQNSKTDYKLGQLNPSTGKYIDSNHSRFLNACLIENLTTNHRIIITDINQKYKYYSCIKNKNYNTCTFEQ
ncbi:MULTISPECIES: hypothetical protein [Prochlorococcus]|uniref:hypothetical protein n=1 Tax=Prochlorococcus TaxID=1218 RepID=UPI0005337C31|nr:MULTISPECIES: hypothetical protein [Prochlorococcus]KGG12524.1 hypothetical protein EV05_1736 [Prochlorococcus sp. MIT 0601]